MQEKTTVWLSLMKCGLDVDIINEIWTKIMEEKNKEYCQPPAPKKPTVSKRMQADMERWRRNREWAKHLRKIKF